MDQKKVIVIGCTHAGTAFITTAKRLYKDNVKIITYERNDTVSFLSCGIALHVGGVVKDPMKLFYSSPKVLSDLGAEMKMRHEVIDVDLEQKYVRVKNLETGEIFEDNYDTLVVTSGSWPIIPRVPGNDLRGILLSKNFYHAQDIVRYSKDAKTIVIVGAGYIGVELAEAFRKNGKDVVLIDIADRVLAKYLDKEFTDVLEQELTKEGIKLVLNEKVERFEGENGRVKKVITNKSEIQADLVILATGFRPNTELFNGKLKTLENGALIVDEYLRTSNPDVFAAGDCAVVWYTPTESYEYIPLATNAVRMGTLIAYNLFKNRLKYKGTQGTSGVKVFSYNVATSGLNELLAREKGIQYEVIYAIENNRPEFMPDYEPVHVKILYRKDDKRIIGGQVMSKADVTESANTLSLAIANKMTIYDLAFADFFFQPYFNKPWNFLNTVALKAIERDSLV
ncbi:NADPH-dependent 2,4-dienoyl-CoA reductase, sulfur reductase [Fervidobacterium changbaicum]|uniref:NADH oxidase n=1 Tax=Fervidobacterium changbaicum TaxID=310769 RepID=A0ABX5QR78_9BACT|nr:FAD-dependent oxidoreductase [Fervidobacterium changbaicum]QAV32823.1 NADH oxidase [Fervidobacterium changbaicum]SDG94156.1 NADPH-dependent 2,4-dienoyl-CoA reductase, sulfur reductase [Fervidobacterium changbaicum]